MATFIQDGYHILVMCMLCPMLGWIFSYVYYKHTARITVDPDKQADMGMSLNRGSTEQMKVIHQVYTLIYDGAQAFLWAEYQYVAVFMVGFSIFILVVLGVSGTGNSPWVNAIFTVIAFLVGSLTSVLAGYVGMVIGTYANARTAIAAQKSLAFGFQTAFKAAVVMGFCLCSFGIFNLYILILLFRLYYSDAMTDSDNSADDTSALFEAIAGYGLGGSSVALFGRVGGGIYTKAADVGADLVGKVENNLEEDDIRNPAVIADNVGDNVGDIAGMGADLFGSFAEASCASLVIAAQTGGLSPHESSIYRHWGYVGFPLVISASGIVACFLTSFFATLMPPKEMKDVEPKLKGQIMISTIIETILLFVVCMCFMPADAYFAGYVVSQVGEDGNIEQIGGEISVKNYYLFFSAAVGLWAGLGIGYVTEYYTSNQHRPTQIVAENCATGAATNVIMGLALGYESVIFPACAIAVAAYVSHSLAGFYGVSLAALGILSTLSIGLTIDAFGPISDNAGGIAEMSDMANEVRERTDALDAAGNTTAAIGKGFAIGSAAFVSLALFSGYMSILQSRDVQKFATVDMLHAFPFAGLLIGAMIPYWFSAMTMGAVGRAAHQMVKHVRREFAEFPDILSVESGSLRQPDYAACIDISTKASLKEMIPPGVLVMSTPLVVGFLFGCKCLAGVLIGALVSGVCGAISASNTGGAWDNAKKYIEQGKLTKKDDFGVEVTGEDGRTVCLGKGSDAHKASVVGDTIGDPLKDTSGPSLNIVMKLMAVESLVFAKAFYITNDGFLGYLGSLISG